MPLELVLSAATEVVTVVVLEPLVLLPDEPDEPDDDEPDGDCVVVNVLPAEFVVVRITPTPAPVAVVVAV